MPIFGIHGSIAGGHYKAVLEAEKHGAATVQIFTKNASTWAGKAISQADADRFKREIARTGMQYPTSHDSYLINLGSPNEPLFRKSVDAFVKEIENAELLGLSYLVTHPGAHTGSGEEAGLKQVASGLNEALSRTAGAKVKVLLETTAAHGSTLGGKFEHLRTLLDTIAEPERVGVCLDTCHVFVAGYRLFPREEYEATFDTFDRIVGIEKLLAFHLNDSEGDFASHLDRHANIGEGKLGLEPFRFLVNDSRFADRPMFLETPKEDDAKKPLDPVNLKTLRNLLV